MVLVLRGPFDDLDICVAFVIGLINNGVDRGHDYNIDGLSRMKRGEPFWRKRVIEITQFSFSSSIDLYI